MRPEISSIGAGIDSFFEYALKWYIMSGMILMFGLEEYLCDGV